jgi:hypothetical protein
VSESNSTGSGNNRRKPELWLLDHACEHSMRRVFPNETVLCKRLKTNKGSWDAMTIGDGVKWKTIETVLFRFFDTLRDQHAKGFLNSGEEILGVAAENAFDVYKQNMRSLEISSLVRGVT